MVDAWPGGVSSSNPLFSFLEPLTDWIRKQPCNAMHSSPLDRKKNMEKTTVRWLRIQNKRKDMAQIHSQFIFELQGDPISGDRGVLLLVWRIQVLLTFPELGESPCNGKMFHWRCPLVHSLPASCCCSGGNASPWRRNTGPQWFWPPSMAGKRHQVWTGRCSVDLGLFRRESF